MKQAVLPEITRRTVPVLPGFAHLAGEVVEFKTPGSVKRRLRTPERLRVSEWAKQNRRVAEGANVGPWRHELAPHTVKIMDTFGEPWVRRVVICGVEQSAKTNTIINCIGWQIDCDPGNVFYAMPTEDTASKIVGEKLKPTILNSPGFKRHLSTRADDIGLSKIKFNHGCTLFPAWANSPASVASHAAKMVAGDEVDKWPLFAGSETDPVKLLGKRLRSYRGRGKEIYGSTPAGRFIHNMMLDCDQVFEYQLRCPDCGEYHHASDEFLVFDKEATAKTVRRLGVEYRCPDCASLWSDRERAEAIKFGRWVCVKGADIARPRSVGFHHRAFEALDVPLGEIAEAYLAEQSGDLSAKIDYAHGYLAINYEHEESEEFNAAELYKRREAYGPEIPAEAAVLTAGVDVQGDRLELELVAWGAGLESWGVDYQVFYGNTKLKSVWKELDAYLHKTWKHQTGAVLRVRACAIDSGYRAPDVYNYTHNKLGRKIFAVKGASDSNRPILGPMNRVKHGSRKVPLVSIGTDTAKDVLFDGLQRLEIGPGFCHFPEHYPQKYFDQLAAEKCVHKTVKGREVRNYVKTSARNEAIDLRVYSLAALIFLNLDLEREVLDLARKAELEAQESPAYKGASDQGGFDFGGGFFD